MDIKILGPGCRNCVALEQRTRDALGELAMTATVTKVADVAEIAGYGVMRTPALVVDDHVLVSGRVPTVAQLRDLLAVARLG
jgi:small redox-active disulfide protein 2